MVLMTNDDVRNKQGQDDGRRREAERVLVLIGHRHIVNGNVPEFGSSPRQGAG